MSNCRKNNNDDSAIIANQKGYTIIEVLFVAAIVVVIAMMGMGSFKSTRRFGLEMNCVSKMKQIAQFQESFRNIGDPALNSDGSYGTFFELQNAGFIPSSFTDSDTEAHDGQPFIPYYKIEVVKSPTAMDEEPDANQYMVIVSPVGEPFNLRIFMMQEDGEVYFLSENTTGIKHVWQ